MNNYLLTLLLIMMVITSIDCDSIPHFNNSSDIDNKPQTVTPVSYSCDNCSLSVHQRHVAGDTEARKKKTNGGDLMSRILPMMVIPFMISTAIIPMMLVSLKMMLVKSMFIGKIAIILLIINMFRSRTEGEGGVFNHEINSRNIDEMTKKYYGYGANEEYGAYWNKKRRKRRDYNT